MSQRRGFKEREVIGQGSLGAGGESKRAMGPGVVLGLVRVVEGFVKMSLPRSRMGQIVMSRKS